MTKLISQRDLLLSQKYENKFSRLDLVVRYMFLETYHNLDKMPKSFEDCRDLYLKMQKQRTGDILHRDNITYDVSFVDLLKSFRTRGYDKSHPLVVNPERHLINSSHRAACSLFFDIENIPYEVVEDWKQHLECKKPVEKTYFHYGKEWFEKSGFLPSELALIEQKRKEIFLKTNLHYIVMLWGSAQNLYDKIEKDIEKNYDILEAFTCQFQDHDRYVNFVNDAYQIDDIEQWKINKKLSHMVGCRNIRILYLDLFSTEYREKTKAKGKFISKDIEALKSEIRNRYRSQIEDYFYDIIIHAGDNYEHTDHIKKTLVSHSEFING